MILFELIEEVEEKDIEEIVLNYSGDVQKFYGMDDFVEEVENYGLEEEKVKKYRIKSQTLYIEI